MNEVEQKVWDKKKIFVFILILGLVASGAVYAFKIKLFPTGQIVNDQSSSSQIKGTETQEVNFEPKKVSEEPSFNGVQNTLQERFNNIKKETEKINIIEIASSSPQIQKVIKDIKNLQNYPRNQAKETCFNICEGL